MIFSALLEIIIFAGIGTLLVVGLGLVLRRWILCKASLGKTLAASNSAIVLVFMALSAASFFSSDPYAFAGPYWPYFLAPGPLVGIAGWVFGGRSKDSLDSLLPFWMSFGATNFMAYVIIPGIINIFLGGLQWYAIGRVWEKCQPLRRMFRPSKTNGNDGVNSK